MNIATLGLEWAVAGERKELLAMAVTIIDLDHAKILNRKKILFKNNKIKIEDLNRSQQAKVSEAPELASVAISELEIILQKYNVEALLTWGNYIIDRIKSDLDYNKNLKFIMLEKIHIFDFRKYMSNMMGINNAYQLFLKDISALIGLKFFGKRSDSMIFSKEMAYIIIKMKKENTNFLVELYDN